MMSDLRKYKENSYYSPEDITEKLMELAEIGENESVRSDLMDALYRMQSEAENKFNPDCTRTLYNTLLLITGMSE